jgi:nicotinamidase-related amidase
MVESGTGRALVLMDFQNAGLGMVGSDAEFIGRVSELLAWARREGLPVFHVMLGFSEGYPELASHNGGLSMLRDAGLMLLGDPRTAICDDLAPRDGETVIVKHRVDAFVGTDLHQRLRDAGIGKLVIAGIATRGVVLSSVRHAIDLDFTVTLVEDCCRDFEQTVHDTIVRDILARQAVMITVAELTAGGTDAR